LGSAGERFLEIVFSEILTTAAMDRDIEYELESEFTLANAVQPAPRKGDFSKRFYEEKERRKLASRPTTNDVREHSQLPYATLI